MEIPFISGSYNLESRPSGVQRTINMVPVPEEPGNERTAWVFKDVPGLTVFATSEMSCLEGPTWTERAASSAKRWTAVAIGGTITVAGGLDTGLSRACAMYSTNYGVSWTDCAAFPDTFGLGFRPHGIAYGNGIFLGLINSIQAFKSSNGISWTSVTWSGTPTYLFFGNGVFVAVSTSSAACQVSVDGNAWTSKAMPSADSWTCGGYGGGVHVILASTSTAKSIDNGQTWSASGNLPTLDGALTVAYGNGVFVATVNALGTKVMYSANAGDTWQYSNTLPTGGPAAQWERVLFVGGIFYTIDQGGEHCCKSVDGITWTAANSTVNLATFSIDWAADAYLHYVAVGNSGIVTSVTNSGVCA